MAVESKVERKGENEATDPIYVGNLVAYCGEDCKEYVVMVTDTTGVYSGMFQTFEGVIVFDERPHGEGIGELSDTFVKSSFQQFEGTITLTGSK